MASRHSFPTCRGRGRGRNREGDLADWTGRFRLKLANRRNVIHRRVEPADSAI